MVPGANSTDPGISDLVLLGSNDHQPPCRAFLVICLFLTDHYVTGLSLGEPVGSRNGLPCCIGPKLFGPVFFRTKLVSDQNVDEHVFDTE